MSSVGILGGAFNPPHNGHLQLARAALDQLGLDEVVLMPAARPPHKVVDDDPGAERRFELCVSAIKPEEKMSASRIELDREGPSFTVDTIAQLKASRPDETWVLILGEDAIRSLPSWHECHALAGEVEFAWVPRNDSGPELAVQGEINSIVAKLGAQKAPTLLVMEPNAVSSTEVRRRVSAGEPIDELVPPAVAAAIKQGGLYRSDNLERQQ